MNKRWFQSLSTYLLLLFVTACVYVATSQLDEKYGTPEVRDRHIETVATSPEYFRDVKPILDNRCVVCHGCYDAPCQLKLGGMVAIDRGASKEKVYDGRRLRAASLSRLFIDAQTTGQWRDKKFYPVLNERDQTQVANLEGGVMYRMLEMKRQHDFPTEGILQPQQYDFSLNRDQQCPRIEEFDSFASKYPQWGMPYGLPALNDREFQVLKEWLATGAKATDMPVMDSSYTDWINRWETFLNGDSLKEQLMSRYIYEHLFIGHLYFDAGDNREFFKLYRSKTPPGEPVERIHTRRPFDDPGVDKVYYRLVRVKMTIIAKQHLPYLVNQQRMERWTELFLNDDYTVTTLPSYLPEVASNPFDAFRQLPIESRYKFMLDESEFTIMGFIKGAVCRGQIALNVINDHFWVVFMDPSKEGGEIMAEFLAHETKNLSMPAEEGSNALSLTSWLTYSKQEKQYQEGRRKMLDEIFPEKDDLTLDIFWDGDESNQNAALTIFRHFDSATVTKGLMGKTPKTAWVISYPLLERIHYLLVAGYDVYGNVGHQLNTRLYMDFLRMEAESNFIYAMPSPYDQKLLLSWYEGSEDSVSDYVNFLERRGTDPVGITYKTNDPMKELFIQLANKMGPAIIAPDLINRGEASDDPQLAQLQRLADTDGVVINNLPEISLLRVKQREGGHKLYSLIRNRSHSNVSSLFGEASREIPEEQTLTVIEGIIGTYPNSFLDVNAEQLPDFVDALQSMKGKPDYQQLLTNFGVRRSHPKFWDYSDWVTEYYYRELPVDAGLLDYNRLHNR